MQKRKMPARLAVLGLLASLLTVLAAMPRSAAATPWRWSQVAVTNWPPGGSWLMAFDAGDGAFVLVTRYTTSGHPQTQTWTFDGTTWTDLEVNTPRLLEAIVYDYARDAIMAYTYAPYGEVSTPGHTWIFDEGIWTLVDTNGPTTRANPAMAYDQHRERVVLYGGQVGGPVTAHTWEWDGFQWYVYDTLDSAPERRTAASMVYDPVRRECVLYGGRDFNSEEFSDTWSWDGQQWRQLATAGPGPRSKAPMAWSTETETVLLIDEVDAQDSSQGMELWEWNGSAWQFRGIAVPPAGRWSPAFAYDSAREQAVMFGGYFFPDAPSDTWILDIAETWVDFGYVGPSDGSFLNPYSTLAEGVFAAPAESYVRIKPGTTSEAIAVSKPLRIDAPNGTAVIIGQ